jgi:hypothetical protein
MKNYVTGYQYSGKNAAILAAVGVDSVCTFKQAVREMGVSGKNMKGIKAVASLFRFSKELDEEGNRKMIWYSVFDAEAVLARKAA